VRRTASASPWTLTTPSNATIKVPAAVPGDAHAALQAAGIIGDVTYRFNDAEYAWVAGSPWTFSRPLPSLSGAGSWTLVCEGLMTIGTAKLDGVALGQVSNQYRRWTFPIPAAIEDEQAALRVLSLEFEPTQQFGLNVGCSRASAAAQSVRQEYLSWGNNGIEDYAQMNGDPHPHTPLLLQALFLLGCRHFPSCCRDALTAMPGGGRRHLPAGAVAVGLPRALGRHCPAHRGRRPPDHAAARLPFGTTDRQRQRLDRAVLTNANGLLENRKLQLFPDRSWGLFPVSNRRFCVAQDDSAPAQHRTLHGGHADRQRQLVGVRERVAGADDG
jgi:hypothetical protein